MVLKLAKKLLIGLAILIAVALLVLYLGSTLSLDRSFGYTQQSSLLPLMSASSAQAEEIKLVRIPAGEFEFRARVAGDPQSDQVVILLHGFPVTSAMWTPMIMPLANAGYRVIAFDQRGYSPGARPRERQSYDISLLIEDVLAIADSAGADEFHLVGHDWGSIVGWATVMQHPERVKSWTALSIAHPSAFGEAIANDPDQRSRSSYIALFRLPFIPEALFTFNGLALLETLFAPMTEVQVQEYLAVFAEPYALTAALNWYRSIDEGITVASGQDAQIRTPTLFFWGNADTAAGRTAVETQQQYMEGPYEFIEIDGDHWLMESHGEFITGEVLEHLARNRQ